MLKKSWWVLLGKLVEGQKVWIREALSESSKRSIRAFREKDMNLKGVSFPAMEAFIRNGWANLDEEDGGYKITDRGRAVYKAGNVIDTGKQGRLPL